MPTLQQVDWRRTRIGHTPAGLHSDPFVCDAAISEFDHRKTLHKAFDKVFSEKSVTQDRAQRLHAALDRLLDSDPDLFNRLLSEESEQEESDEEEEPDEEVDEEENVRTHEVSASARDRSVAMDSASLLDPNENAQTALVGLARKVDVSRPGSVRNSFWHVLWNVAAKMNPASKIKDMPRSVVDFCMDRIGEAG